jgi:ATP/maltotriose-dependent transcriptional regulator MalT
MASSTTGNSDHPHQSTPAPVAADLVGRAGLHAKLDAGRHLPLTLVAAPAGYGKSTAITQWLEEEKVPSAWVSVDEGDSDLRVLLSHLVAAIHTLSPKASRDIGAWTDASEMPSIATLSGSLGDAMQ